VATWHKRSAREISQARHHTGAVTFVQRFGSALQLTPHFHTLVPDGVFLAPAGLGERARFVRLPPPSDADVARLAATVATRVARLLARHHVPTGQAPVPPQPERDRHTPVLRRRPS
jgi:hypothetical protein